MTIPGKKASLSLLPGQQGNMDHSSLLDQADSGPSSPSLTPAQAQVDQLVTDFSKHATDWKSLAAMTVGGMAYRTGKIGILGSLGTRSGSVVTPLVRGVSLIGGLGTEVSAFEITSRSLSQLTGEGAQNHNLWKWNGAGGIQQGWLSSFITFGSLKSFGSLDRKSVVQG